MATGSSLRGVQMTREVAGRSSAFPHVRDFLATRSALTKGAKAFLIRS